MTDTKILLLFLTELDDCLPGQVGIRYGKAPAVETPCRREKDTAPEARGSQTTAYASLENGLTVAGRVAKTEPPRQALSIFLT